MPTSIEAFVLLLLVILPGFISVTVERQFRPLRTHTPMDAVGWYAFYSLIVNAAILAAGYSIAVFWFDFDPTQLANKDWRDILKSEFKARPHITAGVVLGYPIASALLAAMVGYIVARLTSDITPVWWAETVQRTTRWKRFRRRGFCAISVRVDLNNGGIYFGTLQTVPKDYEVLVSKEKDFSIVRAMYVPVGRNPIVYGPRETVLLNTKDVFSIVTIDEPLNRDESAEPTPIVPSPKPEQ